MSNQNRFANAIRFLSVDAIQKSNSGHPGMPLGMADIATVLWREFLQHNPANPAWLNRDRFILSNGHGSMLLYSLLHLTGYDLTINDLKDFRSFHSKTPGHPEFGRTPGAETTTGPLGQGLANAVGMALSEKILAAQFNKPRFNIIDHYTYVFVGDGCLMEGISHEAASFAGTHGLGKLIVFWDDNGISIDGKTDGWFTEDVAKRFHAYNWQVVRDVDGHNPDSIRQGIIEAQAQIDKPTLICCKTIIGFGAPHLCDTHACHGAPLGEQEVAAMRNLLGWEYGPFIIPEDIYESWDAREKGKEVENVWQELFSLYRKQYPEQASELMRRLQKKLPKSWEEKSNYYINETIRKSETLATRQSSQKALNTYGFLLPELIGGSADLTGSNLTDWGGSKDITKNDPSGNYLHYGVREFGMFAMMNGMALYGGFIPYGGTFLVFAGYGQNAIRMSALMKQRVIYVFSHDSIGLGEDGPTHQPVEHLAMLRATPNLSVWRPCDAIETSIAWQYALEFHDGPTALILSRQKLVSQKHDEKSVGYIKKGGYVLIDSKGTPDYILIATGSEVSLAVSVATKLNEEGYKIRVVSMPSQDVFDRQDDAYKNMVLPPQIKKRIAIEAASSQSWYKYVGLDGKVIGLDNYGESAPEKILFEFFGFSEQNVVKLISNY
jgi:transketolase